MDISNTYLRSNGFLDAINCQIHILFKVIICVFCGAAWAPFAILGHCKKEHPDLKQDPTAQSKLDEIVEQYGIVQGTNVPLPTFNGLAVEGLAIHDDGLVCMADDCVYACRKESMMDQHWTLKHRLSSISRPKRFRSASVQCFFTGAGTKYFAINRSLEGADPKGLYAKFIHDYLPSIPPVPMLPPNTHREVPPLIAHTGWNLHLDAFVTDTKKRKSLVESAASPLPMDKDPLYGQLYKWVFEYLDSIRDIADEQVPYTLLKYILQYPW